MGVAERLGLEQVGRAARLIANRAGVSSALAALTFVVALYFTFVQDGESRMPLPGALAVSLVAAGAVWLSGGHPLTAWGIACGATVLQPILDVTFQAMDLVVVLVVFQAAMNTSSPSWLLAPVTFIALSVNDIWQRASPSGSTMGSSILYPALLTCLGVGLGLQSRRVRKQNGALRALADADRERAVSDERRRIARDLHDVAAHHLSALVVRNKLALRLESRDSLRAAVHFSALTAAQTLESLRNVVHVLTTDSESPRAPVPRLAHLEGIFDRVESAGLVVVREIADLGPVDEELEVALVRVIQESLANVLQHRGPGTCWVTLSREGATVRLTIDDDGTIAAPGASPAADARSAPIRDGYGLIGMRERTAARGGEFRVEESPRGGWRVGAVFDVRAG